MNTKSLLAVFALMNLTFALWGQSYIAKEQTQEEAIDGVVGNWPALTTSDDSTFSYALSRQGNTLLAYLQIYDTKLQNHILLTGMTFWLDAKGKKKRDKGIHFPTGYKQKEILRDPMRFREVLEAVQEQKYEIAERLNSMELVNFYGKDSRVWGKIQNPGAINVALAFDSMGILIYEAAIPLSTIVLSESQLQKSLNKGFSIGWETGELGRPELRGDDAVGLSGTSPSNPVRFQTDWDRSFQRELNIYRTYAVSERIWIKRLTFD